MLITVLGLLDLVSGISFVMAYFGLLKTFSVVMGIYLMAKSMVFFGGWASFFDMVSGIVLILFLYLNLPGFFLWIVIIWLTQKGIVTLFSSS